MGRASGVAIRSVSCVLALKINWLVTVNQLAEAEDGGLAIEGVRKGYDTGKFEQIQLSRSICALVSHFVSHLSMAVLCWTIDLYST